MVLPYVRLCFEWTWVASIVWTDTPEEKFTIFINHSFLVPNTAYRCSCLVHLTHKLLSDFFPSSEVKIILLLASHFWWVCGLLNRKWEMQDSEKIITSPRVLLLPFRRTVSTHTHTHTHTQGMPEWCSYPALIQQGKRCGISIKALCCRSMGPQGSFSAPFKQYSLPTLKDLALIWPNRKDKNG